MSIGQYGLSPDDYFAMVERQGNLCAVCGQPETKVNKLDSLYRLGVDHDHVTGEVRGLLCARCNILVAHVENNTPELINLAYSYAHNDGTDVRRTIILRTYNKMVKKSLPRLQVTPRVASVEPVMALPGSTSLPAFLSTIIDKSRIQAIRNGR